MEAEATRPSAPVYVERWPSEIPLLAFVAIASIGIWLMLAFTIIGFVYALFLGLFFFLAHVAFVTHVRGSAVRLGPDQFPELHRRVVELAHTAGLEPVPDAYLMEAGGALNAFASRFLRSRFIVLYSDLLEAAADDPAARDMVIGHELGHVKARHLDWAWFLIPGMFVPFLGSAYSRARELTCDRYGAALCGDRQGALRGLTLLAAGRTHGPKVDLGAFVAQARDLDTGWMTVGKWLSRYPPLCERVAALEPTLKPEGLMAVNGPTRAILILASFVLVPSLLFGVFFATLMPAFERVLAEAATGSSSSFSDETPMLPESEAWIRFESDFELFQGLLDELAARGEALPEDSDELDLAWDRVYPTEARPYDPFDGLPYGYDYSSLGYRLWSSGPDGVGGTDDDIERYFTVE